MFRFFRQIRQKLLTENRVSKYLLYALGEILLVVIGILIALQIDTWNEERKNRAFEREILAQIRENLLQDQKALQNIAVHFQKAIDATEHLLNPSIRSAYPDSIPYWLGRVAQFDRFQPLTNSYEVLKAKGLEYISDDSLRLLLGKYYDNQIANTVLAIADIEKSFHEDWLPLFKDHITEINYQNYVRVTSMDAFLDQTNALRILMMNMENYTGALISVNRVLTHIDTLLSRLPESSQNLRS